MVSIQGCHKLVRLIAGVSRWIFLWVWIVHCEMFRCRLLLVSFYWEFNPLPPWSCLCEDELLLNHSLRLAIAWPMLAAMMVPRESFRRKKKWLWSTKKEQCCSQKEQSEMSNKKKGSWEQAEVAWCCSAAVTQEPKSLFLLLLLIISNCFNWNNWLWLSSVTVKWKSGGSFQISTRDITL